MLLNNRIFVVQFFNKNVYTIIILNLHLIYKILNLHTIELQQFFVYYSKCENLKSNCEVIKM